MSLRLLRLRVKMNELWKNRWSSKLLTNAQGYHALHGQVQELARADSMYVMDHMFHLSMQAVMLWHEKMLQSGCTVLRRCRSSCWRSSWQRVHESVNWVMVSCSYWSRCNFFMYASRAIALFHSMENQQQEQTSVHNMRHFQ